MAQTSSQNNSLKFVFGCLVAIIVLLVVVTQLGLNPTEVTTPGMSVKFKGGLSPKEQPAAAGPQQQNSRQLEEELEKVKEQLRTVQQSGTSSPEALNLTGSWQSPLGIFNIVQYGNLIGVQLVNYGTIMSVGQGTIVGRTISFSYVNNLYGRGTVQGAVSSDNSRIQLTADPGTLFAQNIPLTRWSATAQSPW